MFFIFGLACVLAVCLMIFTRNVIHAAYGLAAVLLSLAGLFVLLQAEYLAVVQIFMYAGGVVVLLVFGIMITNRDQKGAPITKNRSMWAGALASIVIFILILKVMFVEGFNWKSPFSTQDQTKEIGRIFLTDHLVSFELIAVLLLSVLVGAAFLAKRSSSNE